VVAGTEGLLLHDCGQGLLHYSSASNASHDAGNALPNASAHATSNAAANPTCDARRPCRPFQLRCRPREHVESGQEGVVLPHSSPWVPSHCCSDRAHRAYRTAADAHLAASSADRSGEASRPIQLRRWICKLASRLVSSKKGVVLQGPWEGLPQPGRRVRDQLGALRLQRRVRQLAGGLECRKEGMVLLEQRQGLPSSGWGVRMMRGSMARLTLTPAAGPSSGATVGEHRGV